MSTPEQVFRLHIRDARELEQVLPSGIEQVDVTITSPPYWNLKDYGIRGQIGFGQSRQSYLDDVANVLKSCYSVTKSSGSLWLIVDDHRVDGVLQFLPWELAQRAKDAGWIPRDVVIWDKRHAAPWYQKGQMRSVTEYVLFFSKSRDYKYFIDRVKVIDELSRWWVEFPERFSPRGKAPTNIWSFPIRTQGVWRKPTQIDHHCPFPTSLVARIIELTTDIGDTVLDPFAGSGVVLAQAEAMGRRFVGFEINPEYASMYEAVVRAEVKAEWKAMEAERAREIEHLKEFESSVLKLRALKYARQVSKPFLEAAEKDASLPSVQAVICMVHLPSQFPRGTKYPVFACAVVAGEVARYRAALAVSLERAARRPLSQYGICSQLAVVDTRCLVNALRGESASSGGCEILVGGEGIDASFDALGEIRGAARSLYHLYPDYKPKRFTASRQLRSWFKAEAYKDYAVNRKVPLLANVRIDVDWVAKANYR